MEMDGVCCDVVRAALGKRKTKGSKLLVVE
jgi:hypothetical protein